MAPALTVIPDHTLQHLDHPPSDYVDLGPDLDHLTGRLVERKGAEVMISLLSEAGAIPDDLACDMKTISGAIVIGGEVHMRIWIQATRNAATSITMTIPIDEGTRSGPGRGLGAGADPLFAIHRRQVPCLPRGAMMMIPTPKAGAGTLVMHELARPAESLILNSQ
jgi:hypothetical protein